jgi:hypothetical protein
MEKNVLTREDHILGIHEISELTKTDNKI